MEYAVQNFKEAAASVAERIAAIRKRLADLQVQTEQPFEYQARFATRSQRQAQLKKH